MKSRMLFSIGIMTCLIGCGQSRAKDSSGANGGRLTCLIPGYDSVIYYIGASGEMQDVNRGKITDTVFVNMMFKKIEVGRLSMVLKPGGGTNIEGNFREMVNLANDHGAYKRSVDSGDASEEKSFGFSTPSVFRAAMRGEQQPPLKLDLPRDEPGGPDSLPGFPKSARVVIFISGSSDIYAYIGGDIGNGKKYTYPEITDLLKIRKSDSSFSVVIKAAASSTYKNTVNILDVMTTADIKHYALIDITKEEEDYLHKIYP